jgi:hypothetical protein
MCSVCVLVSVMCLGVCSVFMCLHVSHVSHSHPPPPPANPQMVRGTLFSLAAWGLKPKTAETTGEATSAAAAQRKEQEARDIEAAKNYVAPAQPLTSTGKPYSQNKDSKKKRAQRARNKAAAESTRARAVADESFPSPPPNPPRAQEIEKETEYVDSRGRKRKRRVSRSRAAFAGATTQGGYRKITDVEKALVVRKHTEMQARTAFRLGYAPVALELARTHPELFAQSESGPGISRAAVRNVVKRHLKGDVTETAAGRPAALPLALIVAIIAAMSSVLTTRATIVSAPMLQPIAVGIILAKGYGALLPAGPGKKGRFACSFQYIRKLMKEQKWRCVRPQANTRKVPADWRALCKLMVLRLAYFVFRHQIPPALVINADHTGIMFVQHKGRMWITKEQAAAKDKSVQGHGDKRQFTLLATTSAAGDAVPHQVRAQPSAQPRAARAARPSPRAQPRAARAHARYVSYEFAGCLLGQDRGLPAQVPGWLHPNLLGPEHCGEAQRVLRPPGDRPGGREHRQLRRDAQPLV